MTKPSSAAKGGSGKPRTSRRTAATVAPAPEAEAGASRRALRAAGQLIDVQKSLLNKGLRALTPLPAFEDVFDQRVAAALQRLGFPRPDELEQLRKQVAELQRRLAQQLSTPSEQPPKPTGRGRR